MDSYTRIRDATFYQHLPARLRVVPVFGTYIMVPTSRLLWIGPRPKARRLFTLLIKYWSIEWAGWDRNWKAIHSIDQVLMETHGKNYLILLHSRDVYIAGEHNESEASLMLSWELSDNGVTFEFWGVYFKCRWWPGCRRNWLAINFCKLYMDVMSQQLHKEWMLD